MAWLKFSVYSLTNSVISIKSWSGVFFTSRVMYGLSCLKDSKEFSENFKETSATSSIIILSPLGEVLKTIFFISSGLVVLSLERITNSSSSPLKIPPVKSWLFF